MDRRSSAPPVGLKAIHLEKRSLMFSIAKQSASTSLSLKIEWEKVSLSLLFQFGLRCWSHLERRQPFVVYVFVCITNVFPTKKTTENKSDSKNDQVLLVIFWSDRFKKDGLSLITTFVYVLTIWCVYTASRHHRLLCWFSIEKDKLFHIYEFPSLYVANSYQDLVTNSRFQYKSAFCLFRFLNFQFWFRISRFQYQVLFLRFLKVICCLELFCLVRVFRPNFKKKDTHNLLLTKTMFSFFFVRFLRF